MLDRVNDAFRHERHTCNIHVRFEGISNTPRCWAGPKNAAEPGEWCRPRRPDRRNRPRSSTTTPAAARCPVTALQWTRSLASAASRAEISPQRRHHLHRARSGRPRGGGGLALAAASSECGYPKLAYKASQVSSESADSRSMSAPPLWPTPVVAPFRDEIGLISARRRSYYGLNLPRFGR